MEIPPWRGMKRKVKTMMMSLSGVKWKKGENNKSKKKLREPDWKNKDGRNEKLRKRKNRTTQIPLMMNSKQKFEQKRFAESIPIYLFNS